MSTKGASNHYGNTRGGRQGQPTQHTGYAWAKGFNKSTLNDHYNRHGNQVGATSAQSYEAKAVRFSNTIDRKNNESFVARSGSTYRFNKRTGEFAIIKKDGVVITYFKPKAGYDYYLSQKKSSSKGGRKK